MNKNISFLFPAFGNEFSEGAFSLVKKFDIQLDKYVSKINSVDSFDIELINTELKSQYLVYLYSCVFVDILKKLDIYPNYLVGYSMGIYSALYAGEAIQFTTGIKIIKEAYTISHNILSKKKNNKYAMASINGLNKKDIESIIKNLDIEGNEIEIINKNSKYSFVVSGIYDMVKRVIERAKEEGAISAKFLPIELPYHSAYLKDTRQYLEEYLTNKTKGDNIQESKYPIISCLDQREFVSKSEIIKEISNNISSKINWHQTMLSLLDKGEKNFIECGLGKTLFKISKFIDGNFTVSTFLKFIKQMEYELKAM